MPSSVHAMRANATRCQEGTGPARRFLPLRGRLLTLRNVLGPWRPSGAVGAVGVFAVCWSTRSGEFWAPLHDFEPASRDRLIEECRCLDLGSSGGRW